MVVVGIIELGLTVDTFLHCNSPRVPIFSFICRMNDRTYGFWLPCGGQIVINVSIQYIHTYILSCTSEHDDIDIMCHLWIYTVEEVGR